MNTFKKIVAGVSALAIFGVGFTYTIKEVSNVETVEAIVEDDCNDDWLHADGSHLYDKDGNEVWITGANWFGFNCSENVLHGLWSADVDTVLDTIADHGINCLRMPISTELLLSWMNGTPNECSSVRASIDPYATCNPDFCNADGSVKNSMEIFDVIMGKCKKYGIKVLIDIHSPHSDNSGHNYNLWYGKETADGTMVTTEIWQDTLVWLAEKYNNDDTIIGYDLKNEPHGKGQEGSTAAKWDSSTDENNWAYAATNCALAILDKNPNALIFIEGVEQYPKAGKVWGQPDSLTDPPYYPGWWGGQFRGVRDYPIDLGEYQSQLVYSPHDYGPGVYAQTWFDKDFTTQTLLDDYWYDTWAFINEEDIAPLLIGEWGGFMDGGDNEKWLTLLRDYMIDNHINHTFWCINPNSGDTGGLLDYSFENWDTEKYALFEPSLWQDEDGVYIGLDHKNALGKNGQSLDTYYSSGKSSNLDASGKKNPQDPVSPPSVVTTTPSKVTTVEPLVTTTISEPPVTTTDDTPIITTQDTVDTSNTTTSNSNGNVLGKKTKVGDADCDGQLRNSDIQIIRKHILHLETLTGQGLINADVNNDGQIRNNDVTLIRRVILHLDDPFEEEE